MDATTPTADVDRPAAVDRGLRHARVDSPLGPLRVVVDDAGALAGVYLPDHRPAPAPAALGEEVDFGAELGEEMPSYLKDTAGPPEFIDEAPLAEGKAKEAAQ